MNKNRFVIGLVVSSLWIIGVIYILATQNLPAQLNEWGDFFAGVFAPLAFLWLVLGYIQQGDELNQSTEALKLQATELNNTVQRQNELVNIGQVQLEQQRAQLQLIQRSLEADHERRKKQATIEYINSVRPFWGKGEIEINRAFNTENPLTREQVLSLSEKPELRESIRSLLGVLEHMSVGMNTGVFDSDLLYRMSASYLINIYKRLACFISEAQKDNPKKYIEFQQIIFAFEERKRTRPDPEGDILRS